MPEFLNPIEFARPHFLWLALLIAFIWLGSRDRRMAVAALRTVTVLLLILAIADPQVVTEHRQRDERILAFDVSRSIPATMHAWMEHAAEDNLTAKERPRSFVFAGESRETGDWREWLRGANVQADALRPERTNLENLAKALTALPPAPRSVFLFTDGWETEGSVERLIPALNSAGIKIFPILPASNPGIPNVSVSKVLAPTYGSGGEAVKLRVVLQNQNSREVEGTLAVTRNGQPLRTESIKLSPGSQIMTYDVSLPEHSPVAYRVSFKPRRAELDNYAPDNQALAWVTIRPKAKILLMNGQARSGRYLEEIFKRKGFEVHSRTADPPPPAGYGIVVFNDVPRERFSGNYLSALERYVAGGGSFLMLGGESSFAPASYRRTPVEAMVPVEPREPQRDEKNRAVVLLVDKSGSMREENRMLYAQEAAKAVVRQLKDNDLLGIIGFDVSAFTVLPVEPVARLRGIADAQISRIRPGGQTYFYPALLEARRQLERAEAGRKHIILLSDGETRGTQGELVDLVNVMKTEMKITVSAVAIGADADVRTMKRISQYGGGAFHHTVDPVTLPQIVLQQVQDSQREESQPREFTPVQERSSEVLAGFAPRSYPLLRGYMETELKKGARLDLAIARENRGAPLLASWRYGKGKSLALTTDFDGRWSRDWVQWAQLQPFWERLLVWLGPREDPVPQHEARVSVVGNQPVLDLFVYEEESAESRFRFSVAGKAAKSDGTLKKLADGHLQAPLPISAPGDYRIEVTEERGGRTIGYPTIGYTFLYARDNELPRPDFNHRLLADLAQATGGEINPPASLQLESRVTREYRSWRGGLIVFAFVVFLLEVALRKLIYSETN